MNNVTKFANAWQAEAKPRRSSYLWLGKRLRQLLNAYEEEPVPDRFKELLDQLERSERPIKSQDGTSDPFNPKQQP